MHKSTTAWLPVLTKCLHDGLETDPVWKNCLGESASKRPVEFSLHLAILIEPYLEYLLLGRKTVESRFSSVRCAPYGCVSRGDVILLKRSGGPIVGVSRVADVWFYRLSPTSWKTIRKDFKESLCIQDPLFWQGHEKASYATLMRLEDVRTIEPINIPKRDRRGWVVLRSHRSQLSLKI